MLFNPLSMPPSTAALTKSGARKASEMVRNPSVLSSIGNCPNSDGTEHDPWRRAPMLVDFPRRRAQVFKIGCSPPRQDHVGAIST